jgi:hypothetical protein
MIPSKKTMFWKRANSLQRTEEPQEKPKEGNAELEGFVVTLRNRVAEQEKELQEQLRVIDTLRDNMLLEKEVQRKLNEKNLTLIQEKNELRASLKQAQFHHQTANMQIMDLQKIIAEKELECKNIEHHYNYVQNILRERFRELRRNREELEAALQDRITNLNRKCIDNKIDKEELDPATPGNKRITELHIMVEERDLERKNTEAFHDYLISELCVRLRESKRKEAEATPHDRLNKLNETHKNTNSEKNQLEYASPSNLKKLVAVGVGLGVAVTAVVVVGSFIKRGFNLG